MASPLDGFVFLELGSSPSAGYAGRLLGLLGACVVKVDAGDSRECRFLSEGKAELRLGGGLEESIDALRRLPVAGALDATGQLGRAGYPVVEVGPDPHPLLDWALSGAMWLTGEPDGPPVAAPGWQAAYARGAAAAVDLVCSLRGEHAAGAPADGPGLLGERAALSGYERGGTASPSRASRLVQARDGGWVAVTLSRPTDLEMLPAWLGEGWSGDAWGAVERALRSTTAYDAVARAQLLGIPAAIASTPEAAGADEQSVARGQSFPASPFLVDGRPARPRAAEPLRSLDSVPRSRAGRRGRAPLVADMSSLWAGPLCTSILARAGARVVKVEGSARPDGARAGPPRFFALLNAGKESMSVDLGTPAGVARLAGLLDAADLVVESSRPRAMEGLGILAERWVSGKAGRAWLSITGYGRQGPWRQWAALGDDAAAAGGIAALTGQEAGLGHPIFCADAYADPVTGLHAALVALATFAGRGDAVLDVAMREVVSHMLGGRDRPRPPQAGPVSAVPPRARQATAMAPALGEHDAALSAELACAS